ncbi:hypothetical protein ACLBXX_05345 [Microbacterium sp. C23T]
MTTKLVAAIHRAMEGMRECRGSRRSHRAWRASLADTRRSQWHQAPHA